MPAGKQDDSPLIEMATKIGELSGAQHAVLSQLSRLHGDLVALRDELEKKHEENIKLINERHEDNENLIRAHAAEDKSNFDKVFSWFNRLSGAVGLVVILWAVLQVILPFMMRIKLGE